MGLYDTVELDPALTLPGGVDPTAATWQTKDIDMPAMQTYRISADGRLLREETRQERHSEEEIEQKRQKYEDTELPFLSAWEYKTVHAGWTQINKHGAVSFYSSLPDREYTTQFEAIFSDGQLEQIRDQGARHRETASDELDKTVYYDFSAPLYERFSITLIDDVLRTLPEHHDVAADGNMDALVDRILNETAQTNRTAVMDCTRAVMGLPRESSAD